MSDKAQTSNKSYSKDEWLNICREWESSGEPQEKFCIRKSIPYNTFVYWRGKFTKQRSKTADKKFIPVTVHNNASITSSLIKINFPNGVSITGIKDKQTLAMLFALLGIKPC